MTRLEAVAPTATNSDTSLPDPRPWALTVLAVCVTLAAALAVVLNAIGWTGRPFHPATGTNFSVFAGLYAGAQILERAMEFVVPFLPAKVPPVGSEVEKVAQVKADRAKLALGVTSVLGVGIACGFGLFLLDTIGIHAGSQTLDSFVTGLLIGAGTKPLHDFISTLQNQNTPTTGTKTA